MTAVEIVQNARLPDYLIADKTIKCGSSRSVKAPHRPLDANLVETSDQFSEIRDISDVMEICSQVSSTDFEALVDAEPIGADDALYKLNQFSSPNQLRIFLINFTGYRYITEPEARALFERSEGKADVLIFLMSEQIDTVSDHVDNPEPLAWFHESMDSFLDVWKDREDGPALFGTIPVDIPTEDIDSLINRFIKDRVHGVAIDYLGKKPTTGRRVRSTLSPILEQLGRHRHHPDIALYAANPYRGSRVDGESVSPAEDFYAFSVGHDLVGNEYYHSRSPRWDGPPKYRVFDRQRWIQEYIEFEELNDRIPDDSIITADQINDTGGDVDEFVPLQLLQEIEQMNRAYEDIREMINSRGGSQSIEEMAGTNARVTRQMNAAIDVYNDGRTDPALGSFA